MLAAVWTLIALLAGTLFGVLYHLGDKIDALGARLDAKIDAQGASLSARIDALTQALLDHVRRHIG